MIAHDRLNPKELMEMIGHVSIQLTNDTYGHLFPDSIAAFGIGMDAALGVTAGVTAPSEPTPDTTKAPREQGFLLRAREDSNL